MNIRLNLYFLLIILFIFFATVILPLFLINHNNKKNQCKHKQTCDECECGAQKIKLNHTKLFNKEKKQYE